MQKLEQAINQRTEKNYTESEKLFLELVLEDKKNASIHYHFAWLSDNMGLEKRAIKPKSQNKNELFLFYHQTLF